LAKPASTLPWRSRHAVAAGSGVSFGAASGGTRVGLVARTVIAPAGRKLAGIEAGGATPSI